MTSEVIELKSKTRFTSINGDRYMNIQSTEFTGRLHEWRKHRKMSQLDLTLAADVSQRHVSWLETGATNLADKWLSSYQRRWKCPCVIAIRF